MTRRELMDITEDWAETAFSVGEAGVARMKQLTNRQDRRFGLAAARPDPHEHTCVTV